MRKCLNPNPVLGGRDILSNHALAMRHPSIPDQLPRYAFVHEEANKNASPATIGQILQQTIRLEAAAVVPGRPLDSDQLRSYGVAGVSTHESRLWSYRNGASKLFNENAEVFC